MLKFPPIKKIRKFDPLFYFDKFDASDIARAPTYSSDSATENWDIEFDTQAKVKKDRRLVYDDDSDSDV